MRKISRVLALVMCVILMAGLCACGSDTTGTTTAAEAGGTAAGETSAALDEKHDPVTLRFAKQDKKAQRPAETKSRNIRAKNLKRRLCGRP